MFRLRVVQLRTVLRLTQAAAEFGPEERIFLENFDLEVPCQSEADI
jgi:hypothetical protein